MVRRVKPAKSSKLGKQDRWPSDYGVRDRERNGAKSRAAEQDATRRPGAKRQGHAGPGKGSHGRANESAASAQERKKR